MKEDMLKVYGKIFQENILKEWKVTFDYLYNLKIDNS